MRQHCYTAQNEVSMYYPCPNCRYPIECKACKLSSVYSSLCSCCGKTSYYTLTTSTGTATVMYPTTIEKKTNVPQAFQDAFAVGELEV